MSYAELGELRLSPARQPLVQGEAAPQPLDVEEPDHIAAMLDVDGESSLSYRPVPGSGWSAGLG